LEKKRNNQRNLKCSVCGELHSDWPALAFEFPSAYNELSEDEKQNLATIDSDFCTIKYADQTDRFIRVVLFQEILESKEYLNYGLWVSLSEESYTNYRENFNNRDHEVQYFGWLNSKVSEYQSTLNIPTTVYTRKGNDRPEIVLHEDFDHDFVRDYYKGISNDEAEKRIHEMMKTLGNM